MTNPKIKALFGLKYNPFLPSIPAEDLWTPPGGETFLFQVETLVMDGGFALISGEPGMGKSKLLHLLATHLEQIEGVVVGIIQRPQNTLGDFYRELGSLFGVALKPSNRYGGFKALRAKWREHVKSALFKPVLLIDESQEVYDICFSELRILASAHFDSECLLTTVLCGDSRLTERFASSNLLPLASRIRARMILEPLDRDNLLGFLEHLLERAGAPHLMTPPLCQALVDHCAGNLRILSSMAADLLNAAADRELTQLDEKLFIEFFSTNSRTLKSKKPSRRRS
jgi:type II secretory pathway predicted ATPase ExeA